MVVGESSEIIPATSIAQADSEVRKMKDIVDRAFNTTDDYLVGMAPEKLAKVREYERITDNIQKEVTLFLCAVMEKPMTSAQTRQTAATIKIADELESITDYLERIVTYKSRLKSEDIQGKSTDEYMEFKAKIREFYEYCIEVYINHKESDYQKAYSKSEELRVWADDIRDRHLERVSKGEYGR